MRCRFRPRLIALDCDPAASIVENALGQNQIFDQLVLALRTCELLAVPPGEGGFCDHKSQCVNTGVMRL
jgi:hypothetical protein